MVQLKALIIFISIMLCGCEAAQIKPNLVSPKVERQLLEKKQQLQDLITARNMLLKAIIEQDELLSNSLEALEKSQAKILKLPITERTNEQASLLPQIEERLRTGKLLAQEIAILKLTLQTRLAEAHKALKMLK